jgi:hypothetical protein
MAAACDSHTLDSYSNNAKDFRSLGLELRAVAVFKVPAKKPQIKIFHFEFREFIIKTI